MQKYFLNPNLDGNEFELLQNSPVCVLLIHGFTATTVEVKPYAEALFKAGYDVVAPLLPGHNTDPFDLNKKKYTDWTDYMENKLEIVCARYKTVIAAGQSMGGLLSCYLAERYPKITGLLLFAPALSVKNLALLGVLRYFKPCIGQPAESDTDNTDEGEYVYPWKGYNVKPTAAGYELYRLQRLVRQDLAKITQPTLIFQGVHDQTIEIKSAEIVYRNISSFQKQLITLQNSAHCIILDKEFDFVLEKSLQFLAKLQNYEPS